MNCGAREWAAFGGRAQQEGMTCEKYTRRDGAALFKYCAACDKANTDSKKEARKCTIEKGHPYNY